MKWPELVAYHREKFSCQYDGRDSSTHSCRPTENTPRPILLPSYVPGAVGDPEGE